jgi:pentatricopeptide repeat protein
MGGMDVRMAQPRCFNLDYNLLRAWLRLGDILKTKRFFELMHDCGFHCLLSCS